MVLINKYMKYTIYKITNNVNNKFYVGMHETENLNDGYMGSSKILKRAFKKYGQENFTKEISHIFDSKLKMIQKEKEIVNEKFVVRVDTYNLKIGGTGGHQKGITTSLKGKTYEEIYGTEKALKMKEDLSKRLLGRTYEELFGNDAAQQLKEQKSKAMKIASANMSNETRLKKSQRISATLSGYKHPPEFGQQISERMKGKHRGPYSEQAKKNMSAAHLGIKKGPYKKATCSHCGLTGGAGNMKRWHFENCKQINKLLTK